MTIHVENESGRDFPFGLSEIAALVAEEILREENCPYESEINILITDNEGIREYNRQYRKLDTETDVLSFPNIPFETPAGFEVAEKMQADCFQPDSGELILGDIILSADRITAQAEEYGHSLRREYAFLVAHSMLHLCGYDHMEAEEAADMERRQEQALERLKITRDIKD